MPAGEECDKTGTAPEGGQGAAAAEEAAAAAAARPAEAEAEAAGTPDSRPFVVVGNTEEAVVTTWSSALSDKGQVAGAEAAAVTPAAGPSCVNGAEEAAVAPAAGT